MMSILPQPSRLRLLGQTLLDALLPGSCLLCHADSQGELLCRACTTDLPQRPAASCPQCAQPTTHGERCGTCLQKPPHYDQTRALFPYDFPVDRLIQALKYRHQWVIAQWLGRQMAGLYQAGTADLAVPLPLHPNRLRERGFNQSAEIARAFAHEHALELDCQTLVRTRATPPQAGLPLKQRSANVRAAFECERDLGGRRIVLIDDVMTSGASLNEAARTLKLHGAGQVLVIVAARAFRH